MSKYTSEVRFICENYAGLTDSVGYLNTNTIIANARGKIFNFSYPIFDENYRSVLETKILKHFYTREIGAETVGLWQLWLDSRLNEIMPYYNKLYESELLKFNPLYEIDYTRDYKKIVDGEENGTRNVKEDTTDNNHIVSNENGSNVLDGWNKFSDTPQGGLNNIPDMHYLTNATNNTQNSTDSRNNETTGTATGKRENSDVSKNLINNTEDYLEHVKGKNGGTSYSKLLNEYRQTFLNIDMQVIDELNDLFMNLW